MRKRQLHGGCVAARSLEFERMIQELAMRHADATTGKTSREGGAQLAELAAGLRRVTHRHRRLLDRISRAEELADAIGLELGALEEGLTKLLSAVPAAISGQSTAVAGSRRAFAGVDASGLDAGASRPAILARGRADRITEALRVAANSGVGSLELERRADGSATLRIDDGVPFVLPPMLADLLDVLAVDSGRSDDGLVGWKTLAEVTLLLGKHVGRTVSKPAVTQNVYRLRRRLYEEGGVNPYLVQTSRRHGLRFALRAKRAPGAGDRWSPGHLPIEETSRREERVSRAARDLPSADHAGVL
jgi:hypothetical protein